MASPIASQALIILYPNYKTDIRIQTRGQKECNIFMKFSSSSLHGLAKSCSDFTRSTFSMVFLGIDVLWVYVLELDSVSFHLKIYLKDLLNFAPYKKYMILPIFIYISL
jgi:hypothetical protein